MREGDYPHMPESPKYQVSEHKPKPKESSTSDHRLSMEKFLINSQSKEKKGKPRKGQGLIAYGQFSIQNY